MKIPNLISLSVLLIGTTTFMSAQHSGHGSGVPSAQSESTLAAQVEVVSSRALVALAQAMREASAALANDDLPKYAAVLPAVRGTFHDLVDANTGLAEGLTKNIADPLPLRSTLAESRKDFAPFSTAVADVLRSRKLLRAAKLRLFECSMVPDMDSGRWVQSAAKARNPFFGSEMLTCGTELDAPAVARALPAGHPPIDHLTPADYARYSGSGAAKAKADGACGSCGMSKAAMDAGEACEHGKK